MKKQNGSPKVVVAAIIALTIIETVALLKGINGTLMMLICAAIAGLAGWTVPTPQQIGK